jgi:dihydroxyacid dehydratase/phosphogluconate dehydratase
MDGDVISFDCLAGTIRLHVSDDEMTERMKHLTLRPPAGNPRGYLADWSGTVTQASHGCVSRFLYPETNPPGCGTHG